MGIFRFPLEALCVSWALREACRAKEKARANSNKLLTRAFCFLGARSSKYPMFTFDDVIQSFERSYHRLCYSSVAIKWRLGGGKKISSLSPQLVLRRKEAAIRTILDDAPTRQAEGRTLVKWRCLKLTSKCRWLRLGIVFSIYRSKWTRYNVFFWKRFWPAAWGW